MNLNELIELAKTGQLGVERVNMGKRRMNRSVYDENYHFTGYKIIEFEKHCHLAIDRRDQTDYRINGKDFKMLKNIIDESLIK
jgi:hypothetical protein